MSFYHGRAYSVLHPTDFSEASEAAFSHALAIALRNKADLTILHVAPEKNHEVRWQDFPSVRKTLERWGLLKSGSHKSDVEDQFGIQVQKHLAVGSNTIDAIVGLTEVDSFDLLVMGTHANEQGTIFSRPTSSVKIAQRLQLPTLFVTAGTRSCVDVQTGQTSLRKVLLAVDHEPKAQPAVNRVVTMLQGLGDSDAEVNLLYVGQEEEFPQVDPPSESEVTWTRTVRHGSPATEIVNQAAEMEADLSVMVTSGKRHLWDIIAGSTVQNVLKNAPCPVFTLPD
jgi:nucleotide-binding universal stress UspA family protein